MIKYRVSQFKLTITFFHLYIYMIFIFYLSVNKKFSMKNDFYITKMIFIKENYFSKISYYKEK